MIAAATGAASAAISVSPVHVRLTGSVSRAVVVRNGGTAAAAIEARIAGFVLDRRGKPVLAPAQAAAGWLRLRPRRVVLAPGGAAALTVSATAPAGATPGDHPALVLLTTQPRAGAGVAIRLRVGVAVFVRIPGRIVHRLELGALTVRGGAIEAAIANRGNVVERTRSSLSLWRGGRLLVRLGPIGRTLLPRSRGVERFRYRGSLRGWVTARIEVGALRRTSRLRL